jgi:nucleoid-associated protein YgaU
MTDTAVPGFAASATTPDMGAVCPYLLAAGGEWRSASASRDHRCHAVAPPAILTTEKQRRLCLVAEHTGCSTYRAATAVLEEAQSPAATPRPFHRPVTKTAPLVLDRGRIAISVPGLPSLSERGIGQGGLVAVMAVAFGALVVARMGDAGPGLVPGGAGSEATPRPTIVATDAPATADPVPERTLVPTEVEATPVPTAESTPDTQATQQPTAKPTSDAPATYTVKSGDTLSGIASVYGITWQELAKLNGIDDPRRLRVGQELQLP